MHTRTRNAYLNIFTSLLLQLITAVIGLILPRLIIMSYGSAVNGLVSSITQFLSYISLLEAGVGGVITAALYKPLAKNDKDSLQGIIKSAKSFYRKIGEIFLIYIVGLMFVYPYIVKDKFDYAYVAALIVILSISTFLQYFFSLAYINLLSADQKLWVSNVINSITLVINLFISNTLINMHFSIHVVKFYSCLIFALKPLFYYIYVKKHYGFQKKKSIQKIAITQKWNGLAHHIAYFIHNNTDVVVITLFLGVTEVSVYSVYFAVVTGIQRIVTSISSGSAAGIGNLIVSDDKERLNKVVDEFEFAQFAATTILYTITAIMIIPFVKVYTKGITDVNYIRPWFAYIMIIAYAFYCIRTIYSTITLNAGHYKQTQMGAILEALSNIIISILLVIRIGTVGVVIGTMIAMILRCLYDVIYLKNNIIYRNIIKFFKTLLINGIASALSILACNLLFNYDIGTWGNWVIKGALTGVVVVLICFGTYSLLCRKQMKSAVQRLILHESR